MRTSHAIFVTLLLSALALSQDAKAAADDSYSPRTTLPISFTMTVSAGHAKAGDVVRAKTTQAAMLASGEVIPAGTEVLGHVTIAAPFVYDKTPYAKQEESVLAIQFDSLRLAGRLIPLQVKVRAMADPLASWAAREPKSSDLDSLGTVSQIGGDQLVPSQSEVVDRNGDVVAYNKRGGVYARLIARSGCDGSTNEVSVDIYSASACGLYGFEGVHAGDAGAGGTPSQWSLISTHGSPKIWKHTTALLEALPDTGAGH